MPPPLRPELTYHFKNFVSLSGAVVPTSVKVVREETTSSSLEVVPCWKLEMKLAGMSVNLWYEKESPCSLIKYEDSVRQTVVDIIERK